MRLQPSFLWSWNGTIDRGPYLLAGIVLFAIKFVIDWTVAKFVFNVNWSPVQYLVWPDRNTRFAFALEDDARNFSLTMLVISLPFIWTGLMLTLRRLRAAQLPQALVTLFFMPVVNFFLFFILTLVPTKTKAVAVPQLTALREQHQRVVRDETRRSAIVALALSIPLTVVFVTLSALVFQNYGMSLFVGSPFALGMISVIVFGFSKPQRFRDCMLVGLAGITLVGVMLLLIAIEGAICLLMAAPLAYALAFLGSLVGYIIQSRPWCSEQSALLSLGLMVILPGLMAAESLNEPPPELREVRTVVEIAAPPEVVWERVIAFPPLAEPRDWLFLAGVAYPQRAEIHGSGVGAVRHCIFSTGAFVEPIDVWEPPHRLRFQVTDQPSPMTELSPFDIHPAHLDHYLVSQQGQFELQALPDGKTRLVGTTWYTNRMWPAPYWGVWSDTIIQKIHLRVLEHIRNLAESSR